MSFKEQICQAVISLNSREIYQGDDAIMNKLKQYERKCYNGNYILDVLRIVKKSDIFIINDNPLIAGTVDVLFAINSLLLIPNDILLVRITLSRQDVSTMGTMEDMITVSFTNISGNIKVGDFVMAKVLNTNFIQYSNTINATCELYKEPEITYFPLGEINKKTMEIIRDILGDDDSIYNNIDWKITKKKTTFNLSNFATGVKFDGKTGYKYNFGNIFATDIRFKFINIDINNMMLELTTRYSQEYHINKRIIEKNIIVKV